MLKCYCFCPWFLQVLNGPESNLKPFRMNRTHKLSCIGKRESKYQCRCSSRLWARAYYCVQNKMRMDKRTNESLDGLINASLNAHTLSWDRFCWKYIYFISDLYTLGTMQSECMLRFGSFHFVVVVITDVFSDYVNILLFMFLLSIASLCNFFHMHGI